MVFDIVAGEEFGIQKRTGAGTVEKSFGDVQNIGVLEKRELEWFADKKDNADKMISNSYTYLMVLVVVQVFGQV